MNEKWTYFFIGLITSTVLYALIVLGVIVIDTKIKDKKNAYVPLREVGTFKCDTFNNVKTTFDSNIIINDGYLYNINLDMIFSNEQNCMKISDVNIVKIIDNYYISNDKKIYIVKEDGLTEYKVDGKIPNYLMEDEVIKASNYGNSNEFKYYVLKEDGKIYDIEFTRDFHFQNGVGVYTFNKIKDEVYKEFEGEIIGSFTLSNKEINYVVTDKGVYTNKVNNIECMNYADIECTYSLIKNTILEEPLENISYINLFNNEVKYIKEGKTYSFDA